MQASVPTTVPTLANLNRAECRLLLEALARMLRPRICCRSLASVCRSMRICVFSLDTLPVAAVTLVTRLWGWDPKVRFYRCIRGVGEAYLYGNVFSGQRFEHNEPLRPATLAETRFPSPRRIIIPPRSAPRRRSTACWAHRASSSHHSCRVRIPPPCCVRIPPVRERVFVRHPSRCSKMFSISG